MNFGEFKIDIKTKEALSEITSQNRLPHAIIISGGNSDIREEITSLLCQYAVCSDTGEKPCGNCKNCKKAASRSHPDINYVQGSKKTKTEIYSKDIMEEIIRDTAIIPNEANTKVYVFRDVDEKLPVISQNSFLKTLEEPPQNILFLLTCKDSSTLLETILSRSTVISVPLGEEFSAEAMSIAEEIVGAIPDINEYALLKATYKLNKRDTAIQVLPVLKLLIRDSLVLLSGGTAISKSETPKKLTREKILKILNIIENAQQKVNSNINMNLLSTWLCTEIRRISWQK